MTPPILVGGPARETESDVFALHLEGLHANARGNFEVHHHVIPDVEGEGPRWDLEKIERVAACRQRFLEDAMQSGRDLWLVDTDVVVGPGVLEALYAVEAPVAYGVFWTRSDWGGKWSDWPQVWSTSPYGFMGHPEVWEELAQQGDPRGVEVRGGGACTLIRHGALTHSRYYPLLESLRYAGGMWCGEDRTFCLGLEMFGTPQIAVTNLPIVHLHGSGITHEHLELAREFCALR